MQEVRVKLDFDYVPPRVVCVAEYEFCWYDVDGLLNALLELKRKIDTDPTWGDSICASIKDHLHRHWVAGVPCNPRRLLMTTIWKTWPLYSGEEKYPVPSTDPDLSPYLAWVEAVGGRDTMWMGEYGENRRSLLDFLIIELERYHQSA